MKKFFILEPLITFIFLLSHNVEVRAEEGVSVIIKPKQFNGFVKRVEDRNVNVFLGIPYAKPPIGDLRFKKPVSYETDEPINAFSWPNPCSQSKLIFEFMPLIGNKNFSEDCLYLNIWSPSDNENIINEKITTERTYKPVLFWIHGGGLVMGASNWEKTQGEVLAAKGDVVVVSINYRIRSFGFLYTGTDDAPGNVGLWDQALALKWVNEKIRYFGGDPNQITIIGEGGGSWSVSLHLLSPITRNLFKNAIMMSGAALSDFYDSKENVRSKWSEMANNFGCKEDFDRGSAECLRNIDPENFTSSEMNMNSDNKLVIYGDEFLPLKPSEMLKSGDYKKNVNLLMGTTSDEASFISEVNRSKSEAKQILNTVLSHIFPKDMINTEEVFKLYISQLPEHNYDSIRRSIGVALGDHFSTCPTIEFGKMLFSGDRNRSRVYQYFWSAKYMKSWHGTDYSSEVEYFFGSPFLEANTDNTNKRQMSEKLIKTISHFARNGNPSPQEGIEWNSFYMIDDKLITPYYEFANEIKSDGNFGFGFKYECSKLWKKYLINK